LPEGHWVYQYDNTKDILAEVGFVGGCGGVAESGGWLSDAVLLDEE
jgi:hypothetical protein